MKKNNYSSRHAQDKGLTLPPTVTETVDTDQLLADIRLVRDVNRVGHGWKRRHAERYRSKHQFGGE